MGIEFVELLTLRLFAFFLSFVELARIQQTFF
jgi:hypothetical protein